MIYLYDALYCVKEEIDYVRVKKELSLNKECIDFLREEKVPHRKRWYIVEDSTEKSQLDRYHSNLTRLDEQWLDIKETNGEYQISNLGRILRLDLDTGKRTFVSITSKLCPNKGDSFDNPYSPGTIKFRRRYVRLKIQGNWKEFQVSRLVASHFLPECQDENFDLKNYVVIHKNGNLYEDSYKNLYLEKKGSYYKKTFTKPKSIISDDEKDYYLYDSLYGVKKKATLQEIRRLFKLSQDNIHDKIRGLISENASYKNRWVIIDDTVKRKGILKRIRSLKIQNEIWKDIKETNSNTDIFYMISNYGRIKCFTKENPEGELLVISAKLTDSKHLFAKNPYSKEANKHRRRYVRLIVNGKYKDFQVARLVASNFLSEFIDKDLDMSKYVVIHNNGILYCDHVENLTLVEKSSHYSKLPKALSINIRVTCLKTGQVFNYKSINEASRNIGFNTTDICDALNKGVINRVTQKYFIEKAER